MGCCNDKLETLSSEMQVTPDLPAVLPQSHNSFCDVSLESSRGAEETAQYWETWRSSDVLNSLPAQGSQDLSWLFDRSWLSGCREESTNSTLPRNGFLRVRDMRRSADAGATCHTHKSSLENLPHQGDETIYSPRGSRPRSVSSVSPVEWESSEELNCTFGQEFPE